MGNADAAEWSPPPPRQLPALREHLAGYLLTEPAHLFTTTVLHEGRGTLRPAARPDVGAKLLLDDEHQRLSQAQLFYVTSDITHLVRQAAPSLREQWDIQPHDIPAPTGFMLFAEPMAEYVRGDGKRVDIVAVSWGGTELVTSKSGGLWVTFWSATDFATIKRLGHWARATAAEAEAAAHRQNAELTWDNELYLPWGATSVSTTVGPDRLTIRPTRVVASKTTLAWLETVHAAWIFSTPNTLTETNEEHLPRTQRIRAERAGHSTAPVRVVSVSRKVPPRSVRCGEPTGRTVGVRFPVAPFLRRQAYGPGHQLRRWTPVVGHWRGPTDAPVRITKKVNLVDTVADRSTNSRSDHDGR